MAESCAFIISELRLDKIFLILAFLEYQIDYNNFTKGFLYYNHYAIFWVTLLMPILSFIC